MGGDRLTLHNRKKAYIYKLEIVREKKGGEEGKEGKERRLDVEDDEGVSRRIEKKGVEEDGECEERRGEKERS